MTTKEVADELVKLCSEGKFHEATKTLYSPYIRQHGSGRASRRIAGDERP